MRALFLSWLSIVLLPAFVVVLLLGAGWNRPAQADSGKRVVVLGFDGMDYNLVSRYLEEGQLPNLARLRDRGIFVPLRSSTPPESPVAWATFVTGTNPGKTGIFDFLRRNPETYYPELNMTDVAQPARFAFDLIPISPPVLENCRRGESFWSYAAGSGVATTGIMMPMNIPPDKAPGSRVLSGLGVPDLRRTMGTYVYYVDDRDVARRRTGSTGGTEMGGRVIEVIRNGNQIETFLPGPYNPLKPGSGEELRADVNITVDPSAHTVDFLLESRMPFRFQIFFLIILLLIFMWPVDWLFLARFTKLRAKAFVFATASLLICAGIAWLFCRPRDVETRVRLSEGQWSDWVQVNMLVTPWVGVQGFFRLYLIEAAPEFQLYVTPVSIDPRGTAMDLSFPGDFAKRLLDRYGDFTTYGWDSETWALNENVIDEHAYMTDCLRNWDQKAQIVMDEMKKDDWRIFAAVFQGTDHVSHMFWRFVDTSHPMYDESLAGEFGNAVLTIYQRADTLVGRVLDEVLDEDDELIVLSDHGFNSFRKAVNLNRWLADNGYLAEKSNVPGGGSPSSVYELFSPGSEFFGWVDWSKSKAYALGLGQIYINLEGREKHGIVSENERSALIDEIIEGLRQIRDPETGEQVIVDAYRADKIYHGDNMEYAPDIVVGFAPGYRVSWQTCLGVAAENLIDVNMRKWSGDHCSFDPSRTLGILFSTRPITVDDPNLMDLTPSILSLMGIGKPPRCDGRVIF